MNLDFPPLLKKDPPYSVAALLCLTLVSALLYFYTGAHFLAFAGSVGLLATAIPFLLGKRVPTLFFAFLLVCAFLARLNLSEFSLEVGDAAAYTWSGVSFVDSAHHGPGFFPPMTAAVAALAYTFLDLSHLALPTVFFALLAGMGMYFFWKDYSGSQLIATLSLILLLFHPLSVWFSKTTYSETIWQATMVFSVFFAARLKEKQFYPTVILLSILLALTNFIRGDAPFLFFALLVIVSSASDLTSRQRVFAGLYLTIPFLVTLFVMLQIRADYLIGWQYSKVISTIQPYHILLGAGAASAGCIFFGYALHKWFSRIPPLRFLLFAFLCMKIGMAYIFSGKAADHLLFTELSHLQDNFGRIGTLFVGLGFLIAAKKAWDGDSTSALILSVYCFLCAPFALQNVASDRAHEMYLYWSRYYFSSIFVVHFLLILLAAHTGFKKIPAKFRPAGAIALTVILLSTINPKVLAYTIKESYLGGSSEMVQYISDSAATVPTLLISNKATVYANFDSGFLLRRIQGMQNQIIQMKSVSINELLEANGTQISSGSEKQVISVNLELKQENLKLIGERAFPIQWDVQKGNYLNPETKGYLFVIRTYEIQSPLISD